jgi:two-component system sensor histidine kinase UhpB
LALAPITISVPIAFEELAILVAGLIVMLAIDLLLLRKVLFPLRRLTEVMRSVSPSNPGLRLDELARDDAEVSSLTRAFNDMLDRLEAERQASGRAALAAQERERGRIARELHDEIGQSLTAVLLHTERIAADDSADARAELDRVAADVRLSLDDVRRIARRLRPEALDDLGLVNALIALCSRMSEHSGLPIERDLPSGLPALASDTELVIYRIAQEGLNNAVRHAEASRAALSLRVEEDSLVLTVVDDGRGLPAEIPTRSSGIAGMRERTLLVNGQLTIAHRPGGGTEVRLCLPVERGAT